MVVKTEKNAKIEMEEAQIIRKVASKCCRPSLARRNQILMPNIKKHGHD